jgi:transcriptional regulator GlxA family with amidase domain
MRDRRGQALGRDPAHVAAPERLRGIVRKTSLVPWLRAAFERGTLIGGVCSGVAFVAESGLLDGRRATTHWALAETYRERYPRVSWQPEHS